MKYSKNIGLIVNITKSTAIEICNRLISALITANYQVFCSDKLEKIGNKNCVYIPATDLNKYTDTIIVLGGDGTFIGVAREFAKYDFNFIPLNIGRLGFISECSAEYFIEHLTELLSMPVSIEKRMLLTVQIDEQYYTAVNEIVISQNSLARLIALEININNTFFSVIKADGLIVATPTGSTGHSLSAGGPIVQPIIETIILTAICANSLAVRPMLLPASEKITIRLLTDSKIIITIDGQKQISYLKEKKISVEKSNYFFNIRKFGITSFYDTLKTKLNWNK